MMRIEKIKEKITDKSYAYSVVITRIYKLTSHSLKEHLVNLKVLYVFFIYLYHIANY